MSCLTLRAYLRLVFLDLYLASGNFAALYSKVRSQRVGNTVDSPDVVGSVCAAVDIACIWYWKEVHCLQRSAATTYLLRRCGVDAQMVIGAQHAPFRAHAWVEVHGRVVNDKPYVPEIYAVLDRC